MGHAQKSAHSILGRASLVTLGWAHVDQLRWALRRRHSFALAGGVPRWREQRRVAHRRHHYGGAGPPLRQFHAELSESYSAWAGGHSSHSRNDRTIFIRANLRRVVAGERPVRRQSRGVAIGATLPARDWTDVAAPRPLTESRPYSSHCLTRCFSACQSGSVAAMHRNDDLPAIRTTPLLMTAALAEEDESVTTQNASHI